MRVADTVALGLALAACGSSNPAATDGPGGDDDDAPIADGPPPDVDVPPDPCDPGMWCTETAPVATLLHDVFAIDLNNVIAVGAGGVILQRRDNAWTQMTSGTTEELESVWASGPTDVWAVGQNGTILHYDGASWTPRGSFTKDFHGVWGSGPDDVFLAGAGGVDHFTGGTTFVPQALTGVLFAISGSSPTDVWVTGENSKVDHYTGTWATAIDPDPAHPGATYFAILARGPTEVWISTFTSTKEVMRFEGSWVPHSPGSGVVFQDFYAIAGNDVWAAGGTRTGHWDGASWTTETPAGGGASMFAVSGVGSSFWVVGQDGLILHRR